jgi:alpha-tubulin suppressor-like RCC1 family protein
MRTLLRSARSVMSKVTRALRLIMLVLVLQAASGCDMGDRQAHPTEANFEPTSRSVLVRRDETEWTWFFKRDSRPLIVDFSENETGVAIDSVRCPSDLVLASEFVDCEEWRFTVPEARAAGYAVRVGSQRRTFASDPLAVSVFPAPRGPAAVAIAAGDDYTLALLADGSVWTWGRTVAARMDDPDRLPELDIDPIPKPVSGFVDAAGAPLRLEAIAAGKHHSLAVDEHGFVWAWGRNNDGQLGNASPGRTPDSRVEPLRLPPPDFPANRFVAVAAGDAHSLALDDLGRVWSWGTGPAVGQGRRASQNPPRIVSLQTRISHIAAGGRHSLAADAFGDLWAWGENERGQLGDGTQVTRDQPVHVDDVGNIDAIAAGQNHSLAKQNTGLLITWGDNGFGQTGFARENNPRLPTGLGAVGPVTQIAAGGNQSLAVSRSDGTVYAWGANDSGQLGDPDLTARFAPTPIARVDNAVAVAAGTKHSLAIIADCEGGGSLRAWGRDLQGQLGNGTFLRSVRAEPMLVIGIGEAPGACQPRLLAYLVGSEGAGTLTSTRASFRCNQDVCWDVLAPGESDIFALTASVARPDLQLFTGWHWDCSGSSPGLVRRLTEHTYCKARFGDAVREPPPPPRRPRLSVRTRFGRDGASIVSTPAGIDCPFASFANSCSAEFDHEARVTLQVVPSSPSSQDVWDGCDEVSADGRCSVTMPRELSFDQTRTVTVESGEGVLRIRVLGVGEVAIEEPAGFDSCTNDCAHRFDSGTAVRLRAHPADRFFSWADCQSLLEPTLCEMTTGRERLEVAARFNSAQIVVAVEGPGTVTDEAGNINCREQSAPEDCEQSFDTARLITLTATPDAGSEFTGWGQFCEEFGTAPTIETVATRPPILVCAARFRALDPPPPPESFTLSVAFRNPPGGARVTSSLPGIDCRPTSGIEDCRETYAPGTVVTLTGFGAEAVLWENCDRAEAAPNFCEVTLNADRTVTAGY